MNCIMFGHSHTATLGLPITIAGATFSLMAQFSPGGNVLKWTVWYANLRAWYTE